MKRTCPLFESYFSLLFFRTSLLYLLEYVQTFEESVEQLFALIDETFFAVASHGFQSKFAPPYGLPEVL